MHTFLQKSEIYEENLIFPLPPEWMSDANDLIFTMCLRKALEYIVC